MVPVRHHDEKRENTIIIEKNSPVFDMRESFFVHGDGSIDLLNE